MTRDFQLLMGEFQEIQRLSLDKCQDFVRRAQAIARDNGQTTPPISADNPQQSPPEDTPTEEESPLIRPQSVKQTKETTVELENEIAYNQALIQEREQGIEEIEVTMAEVQEIFGAMGIMVREQQSFVDNIEANMESAALRTGGAVRELTVPEINNGDGEEIYLIYYYWQRLCSSWLSP